MNSASLDSHYRMRITSSLSDIGKNQWDALLSTQTKPNPFLSYTFLDALHESGSASDDTGWKPCFLSIWDANELIAAMPLYEKAHSYGEYVFDWAWADAYHRHGLPYYPKLLSAIPFSPVTGNRLLAKNNHARHLLVQLLTKIQETNQFSSSHILFPTEDEAIALQEHGYMLRKGVQFHWVNQGYQDFDGFLASLDQKKRKNIRAERRKVTEAGIRFQHIKGEEASTEDWIYFKRCYDETYREHHSSPYLNLSFFLQIGKQMPEHIHLIFAEREGIRVAASLLIYDEKTVYGRYWGCTESYPCLHFETAYYQSIEFCIHQGIQIFEGGAQGEHKMARGFLPQQTWSAHYIHETGFADAVSRFLERESVGVEQYMDELLERNPYKSSM